MKAWVRERYGGPEVLTLEETELPPPGRAEVLVRVRAASLNAADLDYLYGRPTIARLATGWRRPRNRGLGLDVAGIVEAVGEGVHDLRAGDEVFGDLTACGYGAFAEYALATRETVAPKPAELSFEEAATVPQSGIFAIQALHAWRPLEAGESVLVNGASGNVGPFAIAVAQAPGCAVTGVCSTAKVEFVRSLGVSDVIDYTKEDYARSGRQWDRIVDVAAHRGILASRRALKPGGVYAWIGGDGRSVVEAVTLGPFLSLVTRKRSSLMLWKPFHAADVEALTRLIGEGKLRPVIDRTYALDEVPAALRDLDEGRAQGKLVVSVSA